MKFIEIIQLGPSILTPVSFFLFWVAAFFSVRLKSSFLENNYKKFYWSFILIIFLFSLSFTIFGALVYSIEPDSKIYYIPLLIFINIFFYIHVGFSMDRSKWFMSIKEKFEYNKNLEQKIASLEEELYELKEGLPKN